MLRNLWNLLWLLSWLDNRLRLGNLLNRLNKLRWRLRLHYLRLRLRLTNCWCWLIKRKRCTVFDGFNWLATHDIELDDIVIVWSWCRSGRRNILSFYYRLLNLLFFSRLWELSSYFFKRLFGLNIDLWLLFLFLPLISASWSRLIVFRVFVLVNGWLSIGVVSKMAYCITIIVSIVRICLFFLFALSVLWSSIIIISSIATVAPTSSSSIIARPSNYIRHFFSDVFSFESLFLELLLVAEKRHNCLGSLSDWIKTDLLGSPLSTPST